jgi:hypothetical protein
MKRTTIFALIFCTAALPVIAQQAKPAAPRVQFTETEYDAGSVFEGTQVTHAFKFRNVGGEPLEFQPLKSSCGCTAAISSASKVEPGQIGEVNVTLNTTGIRGRTQKTVTVPSNDPQTPTVILTIKADVRPMYEVSPAVLNFGDVPLHASVTNKFIVRRSDGAAFEIGRVDSAANNVHLDVVPTTVDDKPAYEIRATISTDVARIVADTVRIYEPEAQRPRAHVAVQARVVGEVAVTPDSLYWPIMRPDLVNVRSVTVSSTMNEPLEIAEIKSNIEGLGARVQKSAAGNAQDIILSFKPGENSPETVQGALTIRTNSQSQPTVTVPIVIYITRAATTGVPPRRP